MCLVPTPQEFQNVWLASGIVKTRLLDYGFRKLYNLPYELTLFFVGGAIPGPHMLLYDGTTGGENSMFNALGTHKELAKLAQPLKVDADPAAAYAAGAAQAQGGIQKLGYDGQPAKGGIAPVVVHNGLIYVAGQGANEHQEEATLDITTHVQK